MADVIQAGKDWILYVQQSGSPTYIPVACLKECDFDVTTKMADTSSKCNAGWESNVPVQNGWTMKGSGFAIDANTGLPSKASFDYLMSRWQAQIVDEKPIHVKWGTAASVPAPGQATYDGDARIESISLKSPNNDSNSFDVTFKGNGPLTTTIN